MTCKVGECEVWAEIDPARPSEAGAVVNSPRGCTAYRFLGVPRTPNLAGLAAKAAARHLSDTRGKPAHGD